MPLIRVNGKHLHYGDWKPADDNVRETFVFTHGLGSSQNYYAAVVQPLIKDGFRCVAYDTTGAGRSPYTQIEQSVSSMADDVIGLMDALGVSKAVHVVRFTTRKRYKSPIAELRFVRVTQWAAWSPRNSPPTTPTAS